MARTWVPTDPHNYSTVLITNCYTHYSYSYGIRTFFSSSEKKLHFGTGPLDPPVSQVIHQGFSWILQKNPQFFVVVSFAALRCPVLFLRCRLHGHRVQFTLALLDKTRPKQKTGFSLRKVGELQMKIWQLRHLNIMGYWAIGSSVQTGDKWG